MIICFCFVVFHSNPPSFDFEEEEIVKEKVTQWKVLPTEGGTGLALNELPVFAKEVGINQGDFEKCLSSGEMASTVKFEETDGSSAGVFQLPGTFVIDSKGNTILLSGNQSFDVMKTVINQALAL